MGNLTGGITEVLQSDVDTVLAAIFGIVLLAALGMSLGGDSTITSIFTHSCTAIGSLAMGKRLNKPQV